MHTNLNRQDTVPIRLRNQPCDKTPCRSAYGTDPTLALYCHIPSTNDSAAMPAITTNDRAYMPMIYKPDNRRTDTPVNQPYNKTPCQSAYGTNTLLPSYNATDTKKRTASVGIYKKVTWSHAP